MLACTAVWHREAVPLRALEGALYPSVPRVSADNTYSALQEPVAGGGGHHPNQSHAGPSCHGQVLSTLKQIRRLTYGQPPNSEFPKVGRALRTCERPKCTTRQGTPTQDSIANQIFPKAFAECKLAGVKTILPLLSSPNLRQASCCDTL